MAGIAKGNIFINNAETVIGENHGVINIGSHPKHEKIWDVEEECFSEDVSSKKKSKAEEKPVAHKDEMLGRFAKEVDIIAKKPEVEPPPETNVRQSPVRPVRKTRHAISVKQAMADFGKSKSTIEAWQRGKNNPPKLFDLDKAIQYAVCLKQYSEDTEFMTNVTKGLTTETGRHKGRQTRMSGRIDDPDPRSLHRRPGDEED